MNIEEKILENINRLNQLGELLETETRPIKIEMLKEEFYKTYGYTLALKDIYKDGDKDGCKKEK